MQVMLEIVCVFLFDVIYCIKSFNLIFNCLNKGIEEEKKICYKL